MCLSLISRRRPSPTEATDVQKKWLPSFYWPLKESTPRSTTDIQNSRLPASHWALRPLASWRAAPPPPFYWPLEESAPRLITDLWKSWLPSFYWPLEELAPRPRTPSWGCSCTAQRSWTRRPSDGLHQDYLWWKSIYEYQKFGWGRSLSMC